MEEPPARRFHLILDVVKVENKKLNNQKFIKDLIKNIARIIKMRIIFGPKVIKGSIENPGLTVFSIIDFSHISIHTFTKHNEFYLDIFSCKPFDEMKVIDYVKKKFEVSSSQIFIAKPKYIKKKNVSTR
jgi:S-adenosylmethionine/arginine decarboxylase-like enzyme